MKRMMMMALVAAATMTAFAQKDVIKNAKKIYDKGDVQAALTALQPALTAGTSEEKASAWDLLNEIKFKAFDAEQTKAMLHQPLDTNLMISSLIEGFKAAEECDKYDVMPNDKGKVSPRFKKNTVQRYANVRSWLYNGGIFQYQNHNYKGAVQAWGAYVETGKSPLFKDMQLPADTLAADAAFNSSLLCYQELKDYAGALKYAEMASEFPEKAADAIHTKIIILKETMATPEDTLKYIDALKDAVVKFPEKQVYSAWIGDYYLTSGKMDELLSWADGEIAKNPEDKYGYVFKGEALRNQEKFDEAVECYKKAFELDGTYLVAAYQAGVSLNSKAIKMKDELSDKKSGMLTKANADKVREVLQESKSYLEKVRELDPNHEQVNWVYALYQLYYNLGDKAKADELEKMLNQ